MAKPPPSDPHSDIDGLHRSARDGEENRHRKSVAGSEQQDHHQSKGKPVQNEQKPGGNT